MLSIHQIVSGDEIRLKDRTVKALMILGWNTSKYEDMYNKATCFDDQLDLSISALSQTGVYY
jgi:hypothetical protein